MCDAKRCVTCSAIAEAPKYREYIRRHPQFKAFVEVIPSENLQVIPPVSVQLYLFDQVFRAYDRAVRGTVSPKAALEELQDRIEQERARRKELGYDD